MSKFGNIEMQCFAEHLNCFAEHLKCKNARVHEWVYSLLSERES